MRRAGREPGEQAHSRTLGAHRHGPRGPSTAQAAEPEVPERGDADGSEPDEPEPDEPLPEEPDESELLLEEPDESEPDEPEPDDPEESDPLLEDDDAGTVEDEPERLSVR